MTLKAAAKLPRRVNTDGDLAAASRVAEQMHRELEGLIAQREKLEEDYPLLSDPGIVVDDAPAGLLPHYDKLTFRITTLQRELLNWSNTAAAVVLKQIDARHKSGELVSMSSVSRYLNAAYQLLQKYTDPRFQGIAERDAGALFQVFVAENPGALLEAKANLREDTPGRELEE